MESYDGGPGWGPVRPAERYAVLDLVRGLSLFGVLMINLLYFFRVSLFDRILHFHTHAGWLNHAVDLVATALFEFKAFDLFSLTFGIGVAIQAERAALRSGSVELFLARRFVILLAFGAVHLTLISNVDILTLYAVCGLLLIPLLRLPAPLLAVVGIMAVYLPNLLPFVRAFPSEDVLRTHVLEANRIYSQGGFATITAFRWQETRELIAPLLEGVAQKTWGLMLLGTALWRFGVVREPQRFRRLLWGVCLAAGTMGVVNTAVEVSAQSSGQPPVRIPGGLHFAGPHVPLALAYGAALLAWRRPAWTTRLLAPVAAAGRMALSNYLIQSLVLSMIFNGYGLGLFGRVETAPAAALGVTLYVGQLALSLWWLKHFRFGPFEWLWRSLTYGQRQPFSNRI